MKIDLDLSDIFSDGDEDVNESIKDMIINTVTQKIYTKIEKEISEKVNDILGKGIKGKLDSFLSDFIPGLMEYEFQEIGRYGASEQKTTVKNRILKEIEKECVFKDPTSYSSGNAFTNSLKSIVEEQIRKFKPIFDKEVNAMFAKEALEYAQKKLKERLGI